MIKLVLHNPETGKDETFTQNFVKARHLRQVIQFGVKTENGNLNALDQLDEMIGIVASIFENEKVTYDSILDGISSDKINETLDNIMSQVLGGEESEDVKKPELTHQQ